MCVCMCKCVCVFIIDDEASPLTAVVVQIELYFFI